MEKRDKNRDLSDDQLIMLRQQVLIIGRKKDQFAENLKDLRGEHNSLDKQLKEKRKHLGDDGEILRGEDVRAFLKLLLLNNALFLVEFAISHSPAQADIKNFERSKIFF